MKKLLCATALTCVLSFSAAGALAHEPKNSKEREAMVIKASYSLPKKDGEEFRQTVREADEENLNLEQQVALGHADLYDMLTAPDFDRNAFVAKSAEVRKAQEQMHANRDEAFAAAVAQLSPEERTTLANALDVNPQKSSGHHRHHKSTGDSEKTSSNDGSTATQ